MFVSVLRFLCRSVNLCVGFCMGHFVMVPLNLTYPHCLQHSFFEHLFNLCYQRYHALINERHMRCIQTKTISSSARFMLAVPYLCWGMGTIRYCQTRYFYGGLIFLLYLLTKVIGSGINLLLKVLHFVIHTNIVYGLTNGSSKLQLPCIP